MRSLCLATTLVAVVQAAESSAGSAMVQVRAGLGMARRVDDRMPLPNAATMASPSPQGSASKEVPLDSPRLAAVAAVVAEAGAKAAVHHALQERLGEALAEGQHAIAEDREILKLPSPTGSSLKILASPTINQMLELAVNPAQNSSMGNTASAAGVMSQGALSVATQGSSSSNSQTLFDTFSRNPGESAAVLTASLEAQHQVPRPVASLASLNGDMPELLSTENHMHLQASATAKRVADALEGAVAAEQEAQTLEAKAAELRANASLIMQRGAAVAEQASADIAKKTAQTALQRMADIEREAETAEIGAAQWRAKADSASHQANAAVSNMYHALNMSHSK